MEMVIANKGKRKARGSSGHNDKMKMCLEDYLLLLHSHSHRHLTVPHLNQIISMHGYKKILKVPKKIVTDAVSTLSLIEPSRSTLKNYISPFVITTLDDVVSDLDYLNWKECCVTSIQTLSSWKYTTTSDAPPPKSPRNDVVPYTSNHHQSAPPFVLDSSACGVVSAYPNGAPPAKKFAPRRKRNRSPRDTGSGGGGGANSALDSVSYGSC